MLTADTASAFRSAMEQADLDFVIECPSLPELAYVDRDMWEKIVLNLISNAFKFTLVGRVTVRLRSVADRPLEVRSWLGIQAHSSPPQHVSRLLYVIDPTIIAAVCAARTRSVSQQRKRCGAGQKRHHHSLPRACSDR